MRLGRIASPEGVPSSASKGPPMSRTRRSRGKSPSIPSAAPPSPAVNGRWPTCGCWRRSWRASGVHRQELRRARRGDGRRIVSDPVIFMKPNTAIIGPGLPIQLPAEANPVHFEGELAAVIGRPCKDVPAARVAENILGYTIGNDVSARDQQKSDGQWTAPRATTRSARRPVDRHRRRPGRPRHPAPR